jgi:hypothetical protein
VGAIGAYFSGTTLPPTDRFDVLVQVLGATREEQRSLADARDRVMERRRKDGRALAAPRLPPAANMPPRNHRLVGRDDLIEQLSSSFAAGRNVQALRGMGGVGKTQLAIEYVYRNGADYDVAWLIDAEQPFLIPGQFVTLASHLGLVVDGEGDATTAYVLSHLAKLRSLLIFDDAAGPHRLTPFLPRRGDVLITTRATGFGALGAIVEVDVLARVDAVRLLQARNPALADDDAAELAALLGDLPIAVEQASAYLELTSCPVREYTTAVAEHPERLLRRGVVVGYRYNLANVWSMSINRVAHERPDAMQLLGLCAYLDGTPIPLEIFRAGRDHLPPELAAQLDNPIDFADTVGTLVGFALARRSDDFLFIHRMVQAAVRAHTSTPGPGSGRDDVIDRLTQLLRAAAPVEIWMESTAVSRWRVLMPHVLAVLKRQDGSGTGVNETAWLLDHAGTYLHAAGQAERATSLLARAVELGTSSSAPDDLPILSARLHWAVALRDSGAYDLAEDQYRAVMERYRSRYGEDSLEVAHVVAELGAVRL